MLTHIRPLYDWFTLKLDTCMRFFPDYPVDLFRCPPRPRAPLPFQGVIPQGVRLPPHRKTLPFHHRSYGLMRQTKILLSTSPFAISKGLCRLPLAPAGIWPFPTLSLQSLHGCMDPYPVVFLRRTCLFLPGEHRPHLSGNKFGTLIFPCNATSTGA